MSAARTLASRSMTSSAGGPCSPFSMRERLAALIGTCSATCRWVSLAARRSCRRREPSAKARSAWLGPRALVIRLSFQRAEVHPLTYYGLSHYGTQTESPATRMTIPPHIRPVVSSRLLCLPPGICALLKRPTRSQGGTSRGWLAHVHSSGYSPIVGQNRVGAATVLDGSPRVFLPPHSVRLLVVMCFGLAVWLLVSAVPAVAAEKPETPLTESCSGPIKGGAQKLCGTLNPHSSAKVGSYFAYNAGRAAPEGAGLPGGSRRRGH